MPSRGDLIEIFRGLYKHWAVYVGNGYVVHLAVPDEGGKTKGKVRKEDLDDVAGDDRWRVNNKLDKKHRPRSAEKIVDDALSRVGDDEEYDVVEWNCEHFSKRLRYGKAYSAQVEKGAKTIGEVGGAIVGGAFGSVVGPAGTVVGATAGAAFMNGFMSVGFALLR